MIDKIREILNTEFKTVIASQLSYDLIKTYSILYNNGEQVRTCVNSQLKYYNQLKINGIMKAEKQEETKRRTAVPNWDGLKFFSAAQKHFNSATITDEEVLRGIELGYFKESYFKELPITENNDSFNEDEEKCISEFQANLTQGLSSDEIIISNKQVKKIGSKNATKKLLTELINEASLRNEAKK